MDSQDLRITQENGYALYRKLFNMNATSLTSLKEDSLRLTTATGRCWSCGPNTPPDGSDRSEGIFVRFVNPEENLHLLSTDRDTFRLVTQCPAAGKITRHGRNTDFRRRLVPRFFLEKTGIYDITS